VAKAVAVAAAAGLVVAAALLRWWMAAGWSVNSDEAVVGIMADRIRHGEPFTFYLGQDYGGVEPYVVAAVQALSPNDVLAVNLTAVLLAGTAAVVVGLIVRDLAGGWAGLLAGVTSWVWPGLAVVWSTRQSGFRGVTLLTGLLVLWCAVRLLGSSPGRPLQWSALGVLGGICFWSSPEAAYFLLPAGGGAAVALLVGRRSGTTLPDLLARVGLATGGFVAAALPWLYTNLGSGWRSLDTTGVGSTTYVERVRVAVRGAVPLVLGLRHPGEGEWLVGTAPALAILAAGAAVVTVGAVLLVRRRPEAGVLAAAVALFPVVYGIFPTGSFWNDGRYAVYLPPLLVVVVVAGWSAWVRSRVSLLPRVAVAVAGSALAVGMLASDVAVLDRTHGVRSLDWDRVREEPNQVAYEAIDGLRRIGVTTAYADYWIAYPMTFLSRGELVVDPIGRVRWTDGHQRVAGSDRPAWLFVRPERLDAAAGQFWVGTFAPPIERLLGYLESERIPYDDLDVGIFRVIVPERAFTPMEAGIRQRFRDG
jgi:hypothetical protein